MLSRSLVGLRYSLLIGVSTTVLMLLVGALIGLVAGYYGKSIDTVLMRITDAQLSVPMIILAITILGVSRPTIPSIILVLGLAGWPVYARVMRSTIMAERKKEYVRGAMVLGRPISASCSCCCCRWCCRPWPSSRCWTWRG